MSGFAPDELRKDAFLGGKLHLWQPKSGYRAGIDPVLLAASVNAAPGQSVLDLGCGAGAAALCLAARVPDLQLFGIERQEEYAELARRNGDMAGAAFAVECGDIQSPSAAMKARSFDHVISNPPYYDRGRGSASPKAGREMALGEDAPLSAWIKLAAKRLKPFGYAHFILKAERLGDALSAFEGRLGSVEVLPISPREGRDAELTILRARKEGRAVLRLAAPLVLHKGDSHPGDQDHYTPRVSDMLRRGAALEF